MKTKVLLVTLCSLMLVVGCSLNSRDEKSNSTIENSGPLTESVDGSEEMYLKSKIENDPSKISQDVILLAKAQDDGIITLTFSNKSDVSIDYGHSLYLEKKIDGFWYRLIEKAAFADEGLELEPNVEFEQNIELSNWEEEGSGVFRAYKIYYTDPERPAEKTEKISISNEFKINK